MKQIKQQKNLEIAGLIFLGAMVLGFIFLIAIGNGDIATHFVIQ